MTDTTTSLPVYERRDIPEQHRHLRTRTELKADRLKPADGQQPVALLRVYRRGHGEDAPAVREAARRDDVPAHLPRVRRGP
jgi:hypothetical protein